MILLALLDESGESNRDAARSDTSHADRHAESDELVRRIREGDQEAFESLFTRYHHPLIQFSLSMVRSREFARDIVQDVFLKIWKNREHLFVHTDVRVYLFQSVRNQSLNLIERNRSRQKLEEPFDLPEPFFQSDHSHHGAPGELSDEECNRNRLVRRVWEEVALMPERRRLVFELHKRHGLSYQEISEVCSISLKTVENHIGQALVHLRERLRDELR
jgi:RNA polymerase sigma-70 factor (ECF subfamily)